MTTLAELARIRAEYGLAPVGGVLWLGVGMLPPKRNAIRIDPANLPTAMECRAVAGLDVVLVFPGNLTRYGALRTLSDRLYEAPAAPPAAGRRRPQPDGLPQTGGIMMADGHMDGQMAGVTLGKEDSEARAARIELESKGETARPFDRGMQRGERVVKIRCGADIKPLPITWLWPG